MKKVDNRKVQVRLAPHSKDYKIVQYRIDPSELNWFQRLFNVWGEVEYFYSPLKFKPDIDLDICWGKHLTEIGTIEEVKAQFKTMEDINNFHNEQLCKYDKACEELEKISGYEY